MPPLLLIFLVLGSIFFGIATPTEASGLGAFGAIVLAAINGRLTWPVMKEVCQKTTLTTAFIFGIFLGATVFAVTLRQLGGDELIANTLKAIPFGPNGVVLFILFIGFIAGFFLDWLEISLIILPLVAPVVTALGFDLYWFVVLFAVMLQTSFLTPPVGFSLFYLKGVAPKEVTTMDIYKGVIPFVLCQLLAVILVFEFPQLVLWLPGDVRRAQVTGAAARAPGSKLADSAPAATGVDPVAAGVRRGLQRSTISGTSCLQRRDDGRRRSAPPCGAAASSASLAQPVGRNACSTQRATPICASSRASASERLRRRQRRMHGRPHFVRDARLAAPGRGSRTRRTRCAARRSRLRSRASAP